MADNRTVIFGKSIRSNEYWNATRGVAGAEADILALRNAMRTAFPTPRYRVSDIAKWTSTISASARGYAFIFRDTTLGLEWAFCFRASTSGNDWIFNSFGGSGANLGTHLKVLNGSSLNDPFIEGDMRPFVFFNHSLSQTFAMGFTDTNALTYSGGRDFLDAPTSNPSTSLLTLAAWLPGGGAAPRVPGVWAGNYETSSLAVAARWGMMYDSSIGVLRMTYSLGALPVEHMSVFSGLIFRLNADGGLASATDTQRHGVLALRTISMSTASLGADLSSAPLRVFYCRDNGTTVELLGFSTAISPSFTRASQVDGTEFRIRPIEVQSTGYVKGYLDPRIIAEIGAVNEPSLWYKRFKYPDADNPLVRDHYLYSSAWKKDTPMPGMIPDPGILIA